MVRDGDCQIATGIGDSDSNDHNIDIDSEDGF